ncbi:hypothetical protein [Alicyclobacillus mengziensis]|uniref:Uncharacterized protein n=1 Tax=Alicyclobacillus mengziensis TaxID=2931921 RepID=A0A9X7W3S0_9BACL|nr:hypothetical protein [Alicyclobacillus mengziensis]QSO50094.1 hypothetical protein JZ786_07295 [Alicyclobacillus mengziensis]
MLFDAYAFTGLSGFVTGVIIGGYPAYMSVVGISATETLGIFAVLSLVAVFVRRDIPWDGKIPLLDVDCFDCCECIELVVFP